MRAQHSHTPVISAQNIRAGYRDRAVWENATFDIYSPEFVVVLGPNGAGKTTLFRLLLGLTKPMSGSLELFGSKPERGNLKVGYLPQRRPLDSDTKIAAVEYVRLGLVGHKWGFATDTTAAHEYQLARDALAWVDAEVLANRPLSELSGGEAQRIYLAQAVVGQPKLLLLDEPLANLDIRREIEFIRLVRDVVKQQHITVLLIAHDVNPLLSAVDRIMYVANGKIALGKLDEVVTSEALSSLYDAPIEVVKSSRGQLAVLGIEEAMHHDH